MSRNVVSSISLSNQIDIYGKLIKSDGRDRSPITADKASSLKNIKPFTSQSEVLASCLSSTVANMQTISNSDQAIMKCAVGSLVASGFCAYSCYDLGHKTDAGRFINSSVANVVTGAVPAQAPKSAAKAISGDSKISYIDSSAVYPSYTFDEIIAKHFDKSQDAPDEDISVSLMGSFNMDSRLREPDKGDNVKLLQRALNYLSEDNPSYDVGTVDSIFGGNTKDGVNAYKTKHGLGNSDNDNGVVGNQTWRFIMAEAILKAVGASKGFTHIPNCLNVNLKQGMEDNIYVTMLQVALETILQRKIPGAPTQHFGEETLKAVDEYKARVGLDNDVGPNDPYERAETKGIVGNTTWLHILSDWADIVLPSAEDINKKITNPGGGSGGSGTLPDVDTSNIYIGNTVDISLISAHTIKILKILVKESENTSATITSTIRTPEQQANAMYNNCVGQGPQSQLDLYGANGDTVINVYIAGKNAGLDANTIKSNMAAKIRSLWPALVSNHCVSYESYRKRNVIDIGYTSVSNRDNLKSRIQRAVSEGLVAKFIDEPQNGCFHLEIIVP